MEREREHEAQDVEALNELDTLQALRNCGLLKYLTIPGMKALRGFIDMVGEILEYPRTMFSDWGSKAHHRCQ